MKDASQIFSLANRSYVSRDDQLEAMEFIAERISDKALSADERKKVMDLFAQLELDERIKMDYDFAWKIMDLCINYGYDAGAKLVMDNGFDIQEDKAETSLFIRAIWSARAEIVKSMLKHGVDVNKRWVSTLSGDTPLHVAVRRKCIEVVECLVEHGADVNARCVGQLGDEQTPIFGAIRDGNLPVVEVLVENGADVHIQDSNGLTPFNEAMRYGHKNIFDFLEKVSANPRQFKTSAQEKVLRRIADMSADDIVALPQKEPDTIKNMIKWGVLGALFEPLPYSHQMPLYKATKDDMPPETQQQIQQIIREKRQKQ